jgi:hypothetical protein
MLRATLFLALLALSQPSVGEAEVSNLTSNHGLERVGPQHDPVVRGRVRNEATGLDAGFQAATVPRPERAADVDQTLGIRPKIWDSAMDLSDDRRVAAPCCDEASLGPDRQFGDLGVPGARVYFDPASDIADAEARAAITVVRGIEIDAGIAEQDALSGPRLDHNAGLELADLCRMDPRYRDAVLAPARAEMNLQMDF